MEYVRTPRDIYSEPVTNKTARWTASQLITLFVEAYVHVHVAFTVGTVSRDHLVHIWLACTQ